MMKRTESRSLRSLAAAIALLAGAGCAINDSPPSADHGLDLRGSREPTGPIRAAEIMPDQPSMREYRITSGQAAGGVILQSIEATDDYGADWAITDDGVRIEFWGTDDAGNLVMPVVIDYEDRTISVFDPPLVLVYQEMMPGEQRREEVEIRVLDTRNPDRVRQSGRARRTIEYIDDHVIQTPLGEYRAQRLAVHFIASVEMASIERTSTLYLVSRIGVIAERAREHLRIMNLVDRDQEQTIVLSELHQIDEERPEHAAHDGAPGTSD